MPSSPSSCYGTSHLFPGCALHKLFDLEQNLELHDTVTPSFQVYTIVLSAQLPSQGSVKVK